MISILIPAYNEEKRIGSTLEGLSDFFGKKKVDYEIIVAADGCIDKTPDVVREAGKKNKRIRLSYSKQRSGKGGGLRRAFKESRGEIVVFADADNAAPPSKILKLVDSLDGCDVAWGSRALHDSEIVRRQPPHREFAGKTYSVLARVLFSSPVTDIQCGYKAFKRKVLEDVFDEIRSLGLAYDLDLLIRIKKRGYKIQEIPIAWSHRENSASRVFSSSMNFGIEMIKTRIRTLR